MDDPLLKVEQDASTPRLFRVAGEIDASSGPELEAALAAAAGGGDLTLDMSKVTFVDSSGIRALIAISRTLGGVLNLLGVRPSVRKVLELVGVAKGRNIHLVARSPSD